MSALKGAVNSSIRLARTLKARAIEARVAGRFDESRAYVLTSSPRSGSTLLANMLTAIPRSCVLFEPLNLVRIPEAKAAGFSWRTYVPPDERWPEGEAFLRRVFEGRLINAWTAHEMSLRDAWGASSMIVKFVRANRLLPWMCRTFSLPAPVLLVRHPCAVVASQLKYGWVGAPPPEAPAFLDGLPAFRSAVARAEGDEERLAVGWALDLLPPLLQEAPRPWTVVTYEKLLLQPEATLAKIVERWGVDLDRNAATARIKKPTSVVHESGISGLDGWKRQLSDEQISRILATVESFGLRFYGRGVEADYDALRDEGLPARIRKAGAV